MAGSLELWTCQGHSQTEAISQGRQVAKLYGCHCLPVEWDLSCYLVPPSESSFEAVVGPFPIPKGEVRL